jgi:L-amino acid N-acyltransferase YncA
MEIREAKAADWPAIWPILKEVGAAGETLTWDPAGTEAQARAAWMREKPGRTIVAVDDEGIVVGSANIHPVHSGPGAHVANAGFVVDPAGRARG